MKGPERLTSPPEVFLSYARKDLGIVQKLYGDLKQRSVKVWFDQTDLGTGKWKPQILRAIRRSRYFLICLSQAALRQMGDEPGFQDTELTEAYNIAIDQDEAHFTIIPIRLEDCDRGDNRLSQYQQFDVFVDWDDTLDRLAVCLGGCSLKKVMVDERTESEKSVQTLQGRIIAFHSAGEAEKAKPDVEALMRILSNENEDSNARRAAASAIRWAEPEPKTVVEPLIRALQDRDQIFQHLAAESLLSLDLRDREDVLEPLLTALESSVDPQVRFYAAAAIGRVGPKAEPAVALLTQALRDKDWKVRRISAEALAGIGPQAKSALGPLLETLRDQDNNEWVRSNAALALARIGGDTSLVVEALSSALNDKCEKVRRTANQELEIIVSKK